MVQSIKFEILCGFVKTIISLMAIIRFDNDAISFDSEISITFFIEFTMYYPTKARTSSS